MTIRSRMRTVLHSTAIAAVLMASFPTQGRARAAVVHIDPLPTVLKKVRPQYPADAAHAGIVGTVLVQIFVDRNGRVGESRIVKSIPLLDQSALDCARQWRFKPARLHGKRIGVWVAVPVKFPPE
jgi:protein TonB